MPTLLPLESGGSPDLVHAAAQVLRAGGVIAVPTESFYALAASAFDPTAVRHVAELKGRDGGKPILVLIAGRDQLTGLVVNVTAAARLLMDRFWPGPLTLVYEASPGLPGELSAGTGSIAVRQLAVPELLPLLREVGPLTGTSANTAGAPPSRTATEVAKSFGDQVPLILDGGTTPGGLPSTIVDTRGPVRLIREGRVPRKKVEDALSASGRPLR